MNRKFVLLCLAMSLLAPLQANSSQMGSVIKDGHPIDEATSELQPWCESCERQLREQCRFGALLGELSSTLEEGESVSCFFRVEEGGRVFDRRVFAVRNSVVNKASVRSAFQSMGSFPKPPNLWPKQIGMVATFARSAGAINFGLSQAPAENVQAGRFTGLSETVLEHYLWTPAQRKIKEGKLFKNTSYQSRGCLQ